MKKLYIKDLESGNTIDEIFALSDKQVAKKKDGNPYLNLTLTDKTGQVKGVMWDNVSEALEVIAVSPFIKVKGDIGEYRGTLQLVVKSVHLVEKEHVDPLDFLPASSRNSEKMMERLKGLLESLKDPDLKALIDAFFSDNDFIQKLMTAPAAKKMHHAYLGGLLEHTLSMAILVDKLASHYQGIDRDLLLCGAFLHDIGKIREFKFDYTIDYSDEGRLVNHIVIGIQMIDEKLLKLANFPNEKANLLKHLVVSHHGVREFGSPEPPKTLEAVLLNHIDDIDAKMNGIREFMTETPAGERWTGYHRLLERHFYIGNTSIKEQS